MTDWLLFRGALRDLARPRTLIGAVPLVVLPAALALFWRSAARSGGFDPDGAYSLLEGWLIFGFTLVIMSVILGTGVVSQETEQRTIVYLLTRPTPRWRILLVRFLGALAGITLTAWLSTLLLAAAVFGPLEMFRSVVWRDLAVLPVGALAYGGLFLLVGSCLSRPLIAGLFFAFGWESWIPQLPGWFRRVSVMTYLRVLSPHTPPEDRGPLTELVSALTPGAITPGHARWVLAVFIPLAIGLSLLVFSLKEYVPRDDAE